MASHEAHHLFHNPIADHSFSSDKQTLAVARESNVELYQTAGGKFTLTDELKGHEKTVTGVDVAPNSGRIVTCSQGKAFPILEIDVVPVGACLLTSVLSVQIGTPTSGRRLLPAGSLLWFFFGLTELRLLCDGPRLRTSLRLVRVHV